MPGNQLPVPCRPVPGPERYVVVGGPDIGRRPGARAANRVVVDIAVLAPGAEHHITWAQVARDESGDLIFLLRQRVIGKPATNPLQAVHRQPESTYGFHAFLGTKYAEAFFRPLL
ncbi:hypothetical protein D3C81_1806760 [compost metagenome]